MQEILVSQLGWPSIREDAYTKVPPEMRQHFNSVRKALKRGVFRENISWWPAYEKYVSDAFREIVFEAGPVEEVLGKYKRMLENDVNYQRR